MNQVQRPHPAASAKARPSPGRAERPSTSTKGQSTKRGSAVPHATRERDQLIRRVRAEIDAGAYETPEKLDIAIQRLLKDLRND